MGGDVRQWIALVMLCAGVAFATIGALGMLRSRSNFAALHCLGVAGIALPLAVLAAVLVVTGFGVSSVKTLCFVVIVVLTSPVATHAIALAQRRRRMP